MADSIERQWLNGRAALGAATKWAAEEIFIIAELGYALAEQGCNQEAIDLFEGLSALAPATAYFHSALGALYSRTGATELAERHLEAAIAGDSHDVAALVNLGELLMNAGDRRGAMRNLQTALELPQETPDPNPMLIRARALIARLVQESAA